MSQLQHVKRPPKGIVVGGPDSGYYYLTRHEIHLGRFRLFGWFTAPRSYWRKYR